MILFQKTESLCCSLWRRQCGQEKGHTWGGIRNLIDYQVGLWEGDVFVEFVTNIFFVRITHLCLVTQKHRKYVNDHQAWLRNQWQASFDWMLYSGNHSTKDLGLSVMSFGHGVSVSPKVPVVKPWVSWWWYWEVVDPVSKDDPRKGLLEFFEDLG